MLQKPWMKVVGSVLLAFGVTYGVWVLNEKIANDLRLVHFGEHASAVAGSSVLLIASRLAWPSPRQGADRWLRGVLVLGIALFFIGVVLDAAGAFDVLSDLHDIAVWIPLLGMLVVLVGLIGTFVVRILFRIRKKRLAI